MCDDCELPLKRRQSIRNYHGWRFHLLMISKAENSSWHIRQGAYPVNIHPALGVDVAFRAEHGTHVGLEACRVHAALLLAKLQHVVGSTHAIALADAVQEGDEVLSHTRSELLCQAKVKQDLQSRAQLFVMEHPWLSRLPSGTR